MSIFTITINERIIEVIRFERQFLKQFPQHSNWINTVPMEWWPEIKEYVVRI